MFLSVSNICDQRLEINGLSRVNHGFGNVDESCVRNVLEPIWPPLPSSVASQGTTVLSFRDKIWSPSPTQFRTFAKNQSWDERRCSWQRCSTNGRAACLSRFLSTPSGAIADLSDIERGYRSGVVTVSEVNHWGRVKEERGNSHEEATKTVGITELGRHFRMDETLAGKLDMEPIAKLETLNLSVKWQGGQDCTWLLSQLWSVPVWGRTSINTLNLFFSLLGIVFLIIRITGSYWY